MAEVDLTPMTQDELDAILEAAIPAYAQEHVAAGNWPESEALELALAQIKELLPDGVNTAGVVLRIARDGAGKRIGYVWISLTHPRGGKGAWIYEIEISAEARGQGYGRALLAAAEREAVRHGATSIGLNVFGPNQVARDLYTSAGYRTDSLQMSKPLTEEIA